MARSGAYSGAYVVDVGTGQELYSYRADVGRMPASVEKLYTAPPRCSTTAPRAA